MKQNKNIGRDNGLFLYTGFRGKKFDELRFLIFVVDSGSGKSYTLFIWQTLSLYVVVNLVRVILF